MYDDGFKKGLSGRSIMSTDDVMGWAAGDAARKMNEASVSLSGEEHPHAYQIFILMGIVAGLLLLATNLGWNPFGYLGSFITWAILTFILYKLFCLIPGWLGGTIMGLLLGGGAGYLGWMWSEGNLYWTGGAGIGVGAIMYLMFSMLE